MSVSKLKNYASVARGWLDECIASHTSCRKRARHCAIFCTDNCHMITDYDEKHMNPSRLISLHSKHSEDDEDDLDRVYLVDGQSLGEETPYVALSHRWGARSGITLSKVNQAELINQGIRMDDLPLNFGNLYTLYDRWVTRTCGLTPSALSKTTPRTGNKRRRGCRLFLTKQY